MPVALVDDGDAVAYVDQLGDERWLGRRGGAGEVGVELVADLGEDAGEHGLLLARQVAAGPVVDGADAVLDGSRSAAVAFERARRPRRVVSSMPSVLHGVH